jgi:hypothetical protein
VGGRWGEGKAILINIKIIRKLITRTITLPHQTGITHNSGDIAFSGRAEIPTG